MFVHILIPFIPHDWLLFRKIFSPLEPHPLRQICTYKNFSNLLSKLSYHAAIISSTVFHHLKLNAADCRWISCRNIFISRSVMSHSGQRYVLCRYFSVLQARFWDGGHINRFLQAFFVRRQLSVGDNTCSKNISARSKLFKFCFLYNDFIIKRTRQSKSLLL